MTDYQIFDWNNIVNVARTFSFPSDLIDVIIVAFIVYKGIQFVRDTRAGQLVKGIVVLVLMSIVATELDLKTTSYVLQQVFQYGVIALIVVFQPELRRMLERVGQSKISKLPLFKQDQRDEVQVVRSAIKNVMSGLCLLSKQEIGALIVFERQTKLGEIIKTGTVIDADPSPNMVGSIFFPNSPLHDGAMIVRDGRLYAAGCFLPLSENYDISSQLGTRHRAALGMSENSDAVVVVVSEETGIISLAVDGKLCRDMDAGTLSRRLEELLIVEKNEKSADKGGRPQPADDAAAAGTGDAGEVTGDVAAGEGAGEEAASGSEED